MESHYTSFYCFLLVYARHLVWLGVLLLHWLALDCKAASRIYWWIQFIHSFSVVEINRDKFSAPISGRDHSGSIFCKPDIKYRIKHKRLEREEEETYLKNLKATLYFLRPVGAFFLCIVITYIYYWPIKICDERFTLLNICQNAQVSDTTGDAIKYKKVGTKKTA